MLDLKTFRKVNGLTQNEVADIIGISRSFLGQIECGLSRMPDGYLRKLMEDTNYDTSMLRVEDNVINDKSSPKPEPLSTATEIALMKAEIASLRERLSEAKAEKEKFWEMIQKLMK